MKRFKLTFLLTVLMSMVGAKAFAHDFEVENADGVTIYYSFIVYIDNPEKKEVKVTYRGSNYSTYNEYSDDVVIPESVTYNGTTYIVRSIGTEAFAHCNNLTSVTIPNSVTYINRYAFQLCRSLTSVTIPNSVTGIDICAFQHCSGLTSVFIPNSVTSIGDYAFASCSGLTSIAIPNSVTSIGNNAFSGCSGLTSITIPNSVTSISKSAFFYCDGLTSVTIPNSVTSIGSQAFEGCNHLTSIDIPTSVTSIGDYAFQDCSGLTSITIPTSVTSIGMGTFVNCHNLTSVTLPNSMTSIGEGTFNNCERLTSVFIPISVTSIGKYAFSGCSGLTSITIPTSVTSIGDYAFYGCRVLVKVNAGMDNPFAFGSNAFDQINSNCVLGVPYGTKGDYIANGWTTSVFQGGIIDSDEITMTTSSGTPRELVGYSSGIGLDFTNVSDVKAYVALGYTKNKKDVLLARVNIVPAYTGVVLRTTNPGVTVSVPFTSGEVCYANLLLPAVSNVTVHSTETIDGVDYTNLMIGKDATSGELGFLTFDGSCTFSNKSYLHVPTSYVQSTSNARLGMVFVDSETTDIESLLQGDVPADGVYYDLQGRKVTSAKKGLYIRNGKKVYIK